MLACGYPVFPEPFFGKDCPLTNEWSWHLQKIFVHVYEIYSGFSIPVHWSCCCLFSHVWLFETPWTAARQAPLSFTVSWSLLKFKSVESVLEWYLSGRLPDHFILCYPLLLLLSIFPSNRVFSKESVLLIRWPKYWYFSFSISPSKEYSGLIPLELTALISLLSKGLFIGPGNCIYASTTLFWLVWFCSNFGITKCEVSNTALFKIALVIQGFLRFHLYFRTDFSISEKKKKKNWDFNRHCIEAVDHFGWYWLFNSIKSAVEFCFLLSC